MKLVQRFVLSVSIIILLYALLMLLLSTNHDFAGARKHVRDPRRTWNALKSLYKEKLSSFIVEQDFQKPKMFLQKTNSPHTAVKFNNKLSKLIFQLWDVKSMTTQEESSTCKHLISVDDKQYKYGKQLARKLNKRFYDKVNSSVILDAISDSCESVLNVFRYKDRSRYTKKELRDSYPIAFTIRMDRVIDQSLRMLFSIYHHDNVYCIQPNVKRGAPFVNVFRRISECVPNIILPDKFFKIGVKTHERLKAELKCYEKLLENEIPWKYGLNLPSSAFPLRNNTYLVDFLKTKPYENHIEWKYNDINYDKRRKFVHEVRDVKDVRLLVRTSKEKSPPPRNITLFSKGSYFISTREFYNFLTSSPLAKELLDWSEDTKYPEEFYYATLHRYPGAPGGLPYYEKDDQSPNEVAGRDTVEQENVTDNPGDFVVSLWRSDRSHRCHGAYRGKMCVFGAADLRWLIAQDNLYAVSFDYRIDRVAIECLTRHILKPLLADTDIDTMHDLPTSI